MDWVFQYNPKRYDLIVELRNGTFNGWWNMRERRDMVSVGDRVYFWRAGTEAGITALGRVTSPVHELQSNFGRFAVDVSCDAIIEPPVGRSDVLGSPLLSDTAVFRGWQGTNFLLSEAQAAAIRSLLGDRVHPLRTEEHSPEKDFVSTLSEAIQRNNARVRAELRERLQSMDARAFELLVGVLLSREGYRNVAVTKYTGDQGIDARAVLDIGGGTSISVAVQAKRTKTVGSQVVQSLRGSVTNHEIGLLITSGSFTSGAMSEARMPGKAPIGLIDGSALIDLMVKHNVGISEERFLALRLRPEHLDADGLSLDAPTEER